MTFRPKFHCDGPTCIRRTTADDEYDILRSGWVVVRLYESPEDDECDELALDFCSFECLEQWRVAFQAAPSERGAET